MVERYIHPPPTFQWRFTPLGPSAGSAPAYDFQICKVSLPKPVRSSVLVLSSFAALMTMNAGEVIKPCASRRGAFASLEVVSRAVSPAGRRWQTSKKSLEHD